MKKLNDTQKFLVGILILLFGVLVGALGHGFKGGTSVKTTANAVQATGSPSHVLP